MTSWDRERISWYSMEDPRCEYSLGSGRAQYTRAEVYPSVKIKHAERGGLIVNGRLIQLCNSFAHLLEGICNLALGYAKPLGQFERRGQSSIYDLPEGAL
jgi:hypothetical protein